MHDDDIKHKAVEMYRANRQLGCKEVAIHFGVSLASVSRWVTEAKIKRRPKGRRDKTEPSADQMEILKLYETLSCEQIAQRFGVTKQAIWRVVNKFRDYCEPKQPPFQPGDLITFGGSTYRVVTANQRSGVVINEQGQTILNFRWHRANRSAAKVESASRHKELASN